MEVKVLRTKYLVLVKHWIPHTLQFSIHNARGFWVWCGSQESNCDIEGLWLEIPDFARVCIAWVFWGGGGIGKLVVATFILFSVLTVDETFKDWQVALVSLKDEQVMSTREGEEVRIGCWEWRQNLRVYDVECLVRWVVCLDQNWDRDWDWEEVVKYA